jgi:hypothetical protein
MYFHITTCSSRVTNDSFLCLSRDNKTNKSLTPSGCVDDTQIINEKTQSPKKMRRRRMFECVMAPESTENLSIEWTRIHV